jgi:hypothetical protein
MFNWNKKEKPLLGLQGSGGGLGYLAPKGVASGGNALFAMFGGGGSGGGWMGGGGGGGGYVEETDSLQTGVSYSIGIGAAGGTPSPGPSSPEENHRGKDGGNTTFVTASGTYTAYGGGGGHSVPAATNGAGRPGGSGGAGYNPSPSPGLGNKVTGTTNPAQASPPQPKVLSRVQGYNGGGVAAGDGATGGGGGAGGAGADATLSSGGNGGNAVALSNFGPAHNGIYGGGGGGAATGGIPGGTGGGNAGDGVMTSQTAKNATGYANGGGGVREAGHAGGSATAGIFILRVPDAYTITSPGGTITNPGDGYKYLQRTSSGSVTIN